GVLPLVLALWVAMAGRLAPMRLGLRSGLALLAGLLAVIGWTQMPLLWNLTSDTPSLSGLLLLEADPALHPIIPLLWIALGVAAILLMFVSRSRPRRGLAAIALLFLAMNLGHYLALGWISRPITK